MSLLNLFQALEIAVQNGHEELAVVLVAHGGAKVDHLLRPSRRIAIPKRLELRLREAEQHHQSLPSTFGRVTLGPAAGQGRESSMLDKSPKPTPTPTRPHYAGDPGARQSTVPSPAAVELPSAAYPAGTTSGTLHRATPALPSFSKTSITTAPQAAEAYAERPPMQQARVSIPNPTDGYATPPSSAPPQTPTGNVVDLATVVLLASRVVHAGLHEQFNAALVKELNEATNKFSQYLPPAKEGLRVVSQNLRELGQFPVLGPMDVKRTKRVREDYSALYDRIRPLQDALRVLELDRRAHAPTLVHPPLLYLIGGVFSMFISIEQPYTSQLDALVTSMSRAIRELSTNPSPAHYGLLAASFAHFLRCMAVRVLEIRTPSLAYDIVLLLLSMSKAARSLLCEGNSNTLSNNGAAMLKILVTGLKDIMVLVKSSLPSILDKELLPAEESTLYKEASEQLTLTLDGMARGGTQDREQELIKSVANQMLKMQSAFREIHINITKNGQMKQGLGALGRGVLSDAQKLQADTSEAIKQAAAKVGSHHLVEEWKDARLAAQETMVLIALMVELATACIAVRNRLPNHSHVPTLLVLLSIACQFAFFPM
jgi:hypothetical protein